MTNVFVVSENYIDGQSLHGLFSEREKADAYVSMVAGAEEVNGIPKADRTVLEVEEMELDELTHVQPFFTASGTKDSTVISKRVQYRESLPEPRFFVTGGDHGVPFGAEVSGATPAEAKANLKLTMEQI